MACVLCTPPREVATHSASKIMPRHPQDEKGDRLVPRPTANRRVLHHAGVDRDRLPSVQPASRGRRETVASRVQDTELLGQKSVPQPGLQST